jgi:hypothetical protein
VTFVAVALFDSIALLWFSTSLWQSRKLELAPLALLVLGNAALIGFFKLRIDTYSRRLTALSTACRDFLKEKRSKIKNIDSVKESEKAFDDRYFAAVDALARELTSKYGASSNSDSLLAVEKFCQNQMEKIVSLENDIAALPAKLDSLIQEKNKAALKARQESNPLLKQAIERLPLGIAILGKDGSVQHANLLGRSILAIIKADASAALDAPWQKKWSQIIKDPENSREQFLFASGRFAEIAYKPARHPFDVDMAYFYDLDRLHQVDVARQEFYTELEADVRPQVVSAIGSLALIREKIILPWQAKDQSRLRRTATSLAAQQNAISEALTRFDKKASDD